MKNLETMFQKSFGVPISQVIPLNENIIEIEGPRGNSLMFGSPISAEKQFLTQSEIDRFIESCLEGYLLVGFWGHVKGDVGKAPVKTGMEQEVSLRVIEVEDKSSAE